MLEDKPVIGLVEIGLVGIDPAPRRFGQNVGPPGEPAEYTGRKYRRATVWAVEVNEDAFLITSGGFFDAIDNFTITAMRYYDRANGDLICELPTVRPMEANGGTITATGHPAGGPYVIRRGSAKCWSVQTRF